MSNTIMGTGAVLVAVLIVATEFLGWNGMLQYVWAVLVLIWGIAAFISKN